MVRSGFIPADYLERARASASNVFDEERERIRREYEERRARLTTPQVSTPFTAGSGTPSPVAQPVARVDPFMSQPPQSFVEQLGVPQETLVDLGPNEGWFDKTTRFLANALSPLSVPQDMMFATLAGWADPDKSVSDYFAEMDWANYLPMGEMPNRVVSGERLLRMYGVEDDNAAYWGGLVTDLVADPLLGGLVIRGLGKLADASGAARVAQGLNRTADALDTAAEATMLVGGVPTARVVSAARTLPGFRGFEQAVMNNVVNKYVRPGLEPILQRTVTAPESLGGRSYSLAGLFVQDAGRIPGGPELVRQSDAVSQELAENTMIQLIRADAMAGGNRWKGWLQSFNRSLTVMYDVPVNTVNSFNPATSRAIMTSAYAQADQLGLTIGQPLSRGIDSGDFLQGASGRTPRLQQAVQDVDEIVDVQRNAQMSFPVRSGPSRGTTRDVPAVAEEAAILNQFNSEVARVRQVAQANGDDPDKVESAYRGVVETFQKVSALEGYFASGYAPMLQAFTETLGGRISGLAASNPKFAAAINRAGGVASVTRQAWHELLRSGRRNEAGSAFDSTVRLARNRSLPGSASLTKDERATLRYADMFQNYGDISGLDLPNYFNNMTRGHMRRAFGAFLDETSWQHYVDDMRNGRMATHNIINDKAVDAQVRQAGFAREADLVEEYITQVSPPSPVGSAYPLPPGTQGPPTPRPMGGFVRMTDLAEFLMSRGVDAGRIKLYERAFVAAANPELARVATQLEQYGKANIGSNISTIARGGTGSDVLTASREALGLNEVETLMELMDPIVSRAQTAQAAGSATRRMETIPGILREAEARGLIVDSATAGQAAPKWWTSIPAGQGGFLQGLGGKTVHPMIYREVRNVMMAGRRSHRQASALQTLRSMVTAGYLASPATSAANIAGGFWTAAMYGINPAELMSNMASVYRDWRRMGRDLPELGHMRGIVDNGQAHTEIVNMGGDLAEIGNLNVGVRGFSKVIGDGVRKYHQALRRPLGTGALGLGFFELSEALFKMGTFRMVMNKSGGNIAEARNMARHVVFDYANQPGVVQMARDTGLFLFPGFEYFMFSRTVNAVANRPGMMAAMERAPGVIAQAVVPDEDQRNSMLAGMEDWLREDKFIPIRRKENGDVTLLPWAQIFPTSSMTGAPFVESLKTAGLWGPLIDTVTALASITGGGSNDPGEAALTGATGRRVLESGVTNWSDPMQVASDVASYLYNSFAPALARKVYSPPEDADRAARGLGPSVTRMFTDVPEDFAGSGRNAREVYSRRVDQDLFDSIISFGLRTTRTVATLGPLADMPRVVGRSLTNLERDINELAQQAQVAEATGNRDKAVAILKRRNKMIERFKHRWGDRLEELRRMSETGRFDYPAPSR